MVILWMGLNLFGFMFHWDVYPFILLNLLFSTQANYAAPIIMMFQNRQNERDRSDSWPGISNDIKYLKIIINLMVLWELCNYFQKFCNTDPPIVA